MAAVPTIPDHYARARPAITLGGPAFYTDGGRRERVMVTSAAFDHLDDDEVTRAYRTVAFVDQDGALYDVQIKTLEPADDATWLIAGRKDRDIMGAPPLGAYPSLRPAPVEEVRGDPLDGVEVRALTEDQQKRLGEVDALLSEADRLAEIALKTGSKRGKVGDGQRQEARRILVALQEEIAAKVAADGTTRHLAELEVLEKGRGSRLDVARDRSGNTKVRVRSRGGLQLAWEKGDLDGGRVRGDLLHEVAKRYRDAYERADGLSTPSGGGKAKSVEGRQMGVAQAVEELAVMRGDPKPEKNEHNGVVTYRLRGTAMTRRQRQALDLVCGQDLAIKAAAVKLKAGVPSIRRALRGGLTVAAENKQWV